MSSTALDISRNGATALAIDPHQIAWDATQLAALSQLGLADAGDGDRAVFLHVCQRTGLDPFARQIHMIPRREKVPGSQNQWRTKWTIQTGIDGFRVNRDRAERKAGMRGILSRALFYDPDGNEHRVWVQPRPPVACEITYTVLDRDGNATPYISVLRFTEYAQVNGDGNLIAQWKDKPAHMLEKCTEADVYRKAFPQDFSGIYLEDEATPPQQQDAPAAVRPRGRVTAGEVIGRTPAETPSDEAAEREPDGGGAQAPVPARASSGQLSMLGQRLGKLGVEDEKRLPTLEKLAGRPLEAAGELTQDEAAHIRGLLDRCNGDRGALVELLATGAIGEAPEAERDGGGGE